MLLLLEPEDGPDRNGVALTSAEDQRPAAGNPVEYAELIKNDAASSGVTLRYSDAGS
jgi:hypothetical protein